MARICVVDIVAEEISQQFTYFAKEVSAKVMNPGTEVGVKALNPGMVSLAGFGAYFEFLNRGQIIEKVIEADREGYDAVVVHCFADPGVRIARSVVNIPVIGPGESSLLFACMMGYKFGVVTVNAPNAVPGMEAMIREYALEDRAIHKPVRPITMPWKEWLRKGPKEAIELVLPDIIEKSRECVADGADVIVIGCTMLGPLCTLSGIAKIPDSDIPILDCLAVALKTAEHVVDLNAKLGLPPVSRASLYGQPREKDFNRFREVFGLKTY